MTKRILLSVAVAATLLSACNEEKRRVAKKEAAENAADDAENAMLANVVLPPAIKSDVTYRCKDTSLAHVVMFVGGLKATVEAPPSAKMVELTAEKDGDPLKAEGYSLSGTDKLITLAQPGKPSQTCKG